MKINMIRAKMAEHGLTNKALSAAIGISESAFYKKMAGHTEFTLGELREIKDTLEMSKEDFLSCFFDQKVS